MAVIIPFVLSFALKFSSQPRPVICGDSKCVNKVIKGASNALLIFIDQFSHGFLRQINSNYDLTKENCGGQYILNHFVIYF